MTGSLRSDIGPFCIVPEWVLDAPISDRALRLYAILGRHASADGTAFPGRKALADRLRCSVDSVDRAIAELVKIDAVAVTKRKDPKGDWASNEYLVRVAAPTRPPSRTPAATGSRTGAALTKATMNDINTSPTGTAVPDLAARSVPDRIAEKHLQPLQEVIRRGGGFDLTGMIGKAWGPAWREAEEAGIDPNAVGVKIAGFFFQYVTGEPPNWGRIGQLVKRYGKVALFGLDEAVGHADDPYRYAFRRCQHFAEEREAELSRKGNR